MKEYDQYTSKQLGSREKVSSHLSKYREYYLYPEDKDSLWRKFKLHYECNAENYDNVTADDIKRYNYLNPNVYIEVSLRNLTLKDVYYMKYRDVVYSYIMLPESDTIFVRFFFDIDQLLTE